MKRLTLLLVITLSALINVHQANAQKKVKPPKVRYGKVNKKNLEMKVYPQDSSASAVVLYDKGLTEFNFDDGDFEVIHTRHTRIKILKKEGYKWADVGVMYYNSSNSDKERFTVIKGYTYNLVNGKVVKSQIRKRDALDERVNKYSARRKFTLKNVKEGAIIEYVYTIKSKYYQTLRGWDFQSTIPIVWSEYKAVIPDFFKYNISSRGFLVKFAINKRDQEYKTYRSRSNVNSSSRRFNSGGRAEGSTSTYEAKLNNYHWAVQNMPALREENYITTPYDYISRIEFQLSLIQIPGDSPRPFYSNWTTTDNQLLYSKNFGDQLKFNQYLDAVAANIKAKHKKPVQRALAAYHHVQKKVLWNKDQNIFTYTPAEKVYKTGKGNVAAINLILIGLLRKLDIAAHPVILSTRKNGKITPNSTPQLDRLNYVITQIQMNDKTTVLVDATDPFMPFGTLPYRCLNGWGRVVKAKGGGSWVRVYNSVSNTQFSVDAKLSEDGNGTAKVTITQRGFVGSEERKYMMKKKPSKYAVAYWKDVDVTMKSQKFENLNNIYKPLVSNYELELKEGSNITKAGNLMYVSMILPPELLKNPFKKKTRQYPVDFGYTYNTNYFLNLEIPEGYTVESLPKQKILALPAKGGRLLFVPKKQGNKVQVIIRLSIKKSMYSQVEYPGLREFYTQMVEKLQEKIVLKKN